MKLSLVLLGLFVYSALADICLQSVNPVGVGSPCSATSRCVFGSFCRRNGEAGVGICTKTLALGEKCYSASECEINSQCVGPENNKICVKNASPGESCTSVFDSTIARCGSGTVCDSAKNVCVGGRVGDLCSDSSHCLTPLRCGIPDGEKDQVCIALANGVNCTTSYQCKPTSYCNFVDGLCTERKTAGVCNQASECATRYTCARKSAEDQPQCVEEISFPAGSYCESSNVCESKRCNSGYCADKSAINCDSGSDDCAYDETCRCGGDILLGNGGFGKCVTNPCYRVMESVQKCLEGKCHTLGDYDNSCAFVNCESKVKAYYKCSSAGALFASVVTVFAMLLVSFVF